MKHSVLAAVFALTLPHELQERIPKDSPLLFSAGLVDPVEEFLSQVKGKRDSADRLRQAMAPFHPCETSGQAVFCLGFDF